MRYWPIADIRVHTARLEMRLPTPADVEDLCELVAAGLFEPGSVLRFGWYDEDPSQRATATFKHLHDAIGSWQVENWRLPMAVVFDGAVVGCQTLIGDSFVERREVATGSWLTPAARGLRIGIEMREGVLALGKELSARWAVSDALVENGPSQGVSRSVGYAEDGLLVREWNGDGRLCQRFRLDLSSWQPSSPAVVSGVAAAAEQFGL